MDLAALQCISLDKKGRRNVEMFKATTSFIAVNNLR